MLKLPNLAVLDIQGNRIDDPEIVEVIANMPSLKVLYLQGNDVVKKIKQYRKTIIHRCRLLKYLDDRPVFEDERRRVDAWGRALNESGGDVKAAQEAERLELEAIRREKKESDDRNFLLFEQMMIEGRRKRREEEELKKKSKEENPAQSGNNDEEVEISHFSGERIVPVQDCAFLQQEREQRWAKVVNSADALSPPYGGAIKETNQEEGGFVSVQERGSDDSGIRHVDQRRLEVLHQCATVGLGNISSRDPFVDTSFQVTSTDQPGEMKNRINEVIPPSFSATESASVQPPPAPATHADIIKENAHAKVQALNASKEAAKASMTITEVDSPILPPPAPLPSIVVHESGSDTLPLPPSNCTDNSTPDTLSLHTNVDELD